jgi:hypothetical protein
MRKKIVTKSTEGDQDPPLKKYDECPAGRANPEEGCELEGWQDGPEGYGNYVHGVCETCDDERPERTEEQKEAAEDQVIGCQPEDDHCDYDENCEWTSIDCIDDVNMGDDGEDSDDDSEESDKETDEEEAKDKGCDEYDDYCDESEGCQRSDVDYIDDEVVEEGYEYNG